MKKFKLILIFELLVFYFAVLNIISQARAPVQYRRAEEPFVAASDFSAFSGDVQISDGKIVIRNDTAQQAAGAEANIFLQGVEKLNICFSAQTADDTEGLLVVDLYNGEADYDDPEQQCEVVVASASAVIDIELSPGEHAPENACLRFFTTDPVSFQLSDLEVYELRPHRDNVIRAIIVAAVVAGSICLTWIWRLAVSKKQMQNQNRKGI